MNLRMLRVDKSCVLKILIGKCRHIPGPIHRACAVNYSLTPRVLFNEHHGGETFDFRAWTNDNGTDFELEKELTIEQVSSLFPRLNNISFECIEVDSDDSDVSNTEDDDLFSSTPVTPKKDVNAELMRRKRAFATLKSSTTRNFNRKDELYNEVVMIFKNCNIDFPSSDEASYCISVITNALWYITNHHQTIHDRSKNNKSIRTIPEVFAHLDGYNDVKRKKVKAVQLQSTDLNSHAQALYALLLRPGKATNVWKTMRENVKQLADCLNSYREYLDAMKERVTSVQESSTPARQLSDDADVKHVPPSNFPDSQYDMIDHAVRENGLHNPVIFDENAHVSTPFKDRLERFRFFENFRLSVPVDMIRFCPGGSSVSTTCIVQVNSSRSTSEIVSDGVNFLARVRTELKEFHTRAQRRHFRRRVENVASVNSTLLNLIYKELALDGTAADHPEIEDRIHAMLLGASGLVADLRTLNKGRPGGKFEVFFEKMGDYLNELASCDDRRHGGAHMSEWLSLQDLIDKVAAKCPPDTTIPSKTLVRLQFTPSNPYTRAALSFTSRFPLQHKIQRRQLRAKHPDDHYCASQYKYLRCRAVEEGSNALFFSCDDKSKIHVGEPDAPVSTGVRGKTSITTTDTTLEALDHDLYKSSLTPNVVLRIAVPEAPDKSFVRGQVYFTVSDSVFQSSSPFRHGVMLEKIYETLSEKPLTVLKYTDGGTDQRNTLESVRVSAVCIFKHLNLDMLIAGRCAPGHSYTNPAERIMSILNLGLQNVATERSKGTDEFEKQLKKCNSMQEIRDANKSSSIIKDEWEKSIHPVQQIITNRFSRLNLKNEYFESIPTVTDEEITRFKERIPQLFPGLEPDKLQKKYTSKVPIYNEWKKAHCRETHYTFQVRKCSNITCCSPPSRTMETLRWLPTPILSDDGIHFKKYDDVKDSQITSEDGRPSLSVKKTKTKKKDDNVTKAAASSVTTNVADFSLSAQTARATVTCVECRKPRVVYSKTKFDFRHKVMLARNVSSFEYSCGAELFPPGEKRKMANAMVLRPNLSCATQVEVPYYGENDVGRKDICSHCGAPDSIKSDVLLKKFKTVLPLCNECEKSGKIPYTQRPFGEKQKQK